MQLTTWSPLLDVEREMRNLLGRYWPAEDDGIIRLTTDMYREGDKLIVTVELPGVDPEKDVDVAVEGENLVIKGEKRAEREVEEEDRYLRERRYGRFERTLRLPDGVDPDSITATYDKGILAVEVPVPEPRTEARPIPIKTGTENL